MSYLTIRYSNLLTYTEFCKSLDFNTLKPLLEEYSKKAKNYKKDENNIFKLLNLRENSHSALFKWLININGEEKNSIQHKFLKSFTDYLKCMNYIKIDDVDEFRKDILSDIKIEDCTCKFENADDKYMDICFSSKKAGFVCVIENKLDAKINTDKTTHRTQLEYYRDHIKKEYKDYKTKLFLFLSCNDITSKPLSHKKVCNCEIIKFGSCDENICNMKLDTYLSKLDYKTVEYSDIILILYKILKEKGIEVDELKFEKKEKIDIINEIADNLKEKNKKTFKEKIAEITEKIRNNEKIEKPIRRFNYCGFEELFKNKDEDYILKFIAEYIQYWEYFANFNGGYTKIVDTSSDEIFIWDVFEQIKEKKEHLNENIQLFKL